MEFINQTLTESKEMKGGNSLPQPSQSFIEQFVTQYNKGNVIKQVMVEYGQRFKVHGDKHTNNDKPDVILKLVINSDNTINIKNVKDNWSREEVFDLMEISIQRGIQLNNDLKVIHKKVHIDKWIEQKL